MEFKWTTDTSSECYQDAVSIRKIVFVKEQEVPEELEIDEWEEKAIHVVGYDENQPCVTARILEKEPHLFKVQRVAVLKEFRKLGNGYKLMKEVERKVQELGGEKLVLGSQDHAIPFYEKIGFTVFGEGFLDAGIPHHNMMKAVEST